MIAVLRVATFVAALVLVIDAARAEGESEPVRVDGIAALVGSTAAGAGTDVVLRSDVELRAKMALRARGLASDEPLSERLLAASLREILGEFLIAREAERLRLGSPDARVIAQERARLDESVGGAEAMARFLSALRAGPEELDAIARRRAVVQEFLKANLEGATEIGEAELERGYALGNHPFTDQPFESVREPLRAWLAQRAIERAVLRWILVLKARTPMRVVAEYGAAWGPRGDEP